MVMYDAIDAVVANVEAMNAAIDGIFDGDASATFGGVDEFVAASSAMP